MNLVSNHYQFQVLDPTGQEDTLIAVLPFFHIYGMTVILNSALRQGSTVICIPSFELELFLDLMQKYKVTRTHLVPPIVLALAKHPMVDKYQFPKLKTIMTEEAPLGSDLSDTCAKRLRYTVKQRFGLTGTSPVTHMNPDPPVKIVHGSIGICFPNTECRIVDLENKDPVKQGQLGERGERGELWIREPQVMKGYLKNPQATAETIDKEGWLHTGDIVELNEFGYLKSLTVTKN